MSAQGEPLFFKLDLELEYILHKVMFENTDRATIFDNIRTIRSAKN